MELAKYTVFVRYALLIAGSFLVQRGWLDGGIVDEVARDPIVLEVVAGLALWSITGVWYWWSASRKALKEAISDAKL